MNFERSQPLALPQQQPPEQREGRKYWVFCIFSVGKTKNRLLNPRFGFRIMGINVARDCVSFCLGRHERQRMHKHFHPFTPHLLLLLLLLLLFLLSLSLSRSPSPLPPSHPPSSSLFCFCFRFFFGVAAGGVREKKKKLGGAHLLRPPARDNEQFSWPVPPDVWPDWYNNARLRGASPAAVAFFYFIF